MQISKNILYLKKEVRKSVQAYLRKKEKVIRKKRKRVRETRKKNG
jgi:hypothetical protein